jgi:hypothetical protein
MLAALRIDTLKFARRLTAAGLDQKAAEAIAEGVAEADTSELATKLDIAELRADFAALRADFADLRTVAREDIAGLDTKIVELKAEVFRFMLVQAVAVVGLTVALIKLLP